MDENTPNESQTEEPPAEAFSPPSPDDENRRSRARVDDEHERHCFVVMPFGRDTADRKHFRGWYEVVIEPAIRDVGLIPILAAAIDEPNAINDEIRAHLAFDPMVVVDIGGVLPTDSPNPNVMYELGVRHALDLPLVLMAWEGQTLPFDISNQRALVGGRTMVDIAPTRQRLARFIEAARDGRFYRPMQAVRRIATVDLAASELTEQSVLGAVAEELRELRHAVSRRPDRSRQRANQSDVSSGSRSKSLSLAKIADDRKSSLRERFGELGGSQSGWSILMSLRSGKLASDPRAWSDHQWDRLFQHYVAASEPRVHKEVLSLANDAVGDVGGPQSVSEAEAGEPAPLGRNADQLSDSEPDRQEPPAEV